MKKLILLVMLPIILFSQMEFAEPKPSFDNPRKWVIKLHSSDVYTVNHTLGAIYNVLEIYPPESIQIAVVTYAQGVRVLKKDYDPHTLKRIKSLMDYDVEFISCQNTMDTMHWTKDQFIEDISYVKAGIAELIERSAAGWIEITPY
jgi:intracellular sulfur oxidation DsrE/DsrF family protein